MSKLHSATPKTFQTTMNEDQNERKNIKITHNNVPGLEIMCAGNGEGDITV